MERKSYSNLWSKVARFLLVGGSSTLIDFSMYMFLSYWGPMELAKAAGMIIASFYSYIANKLFTFKNKEKTSCSYLVRFYLVFVANLVVNVSVNSFVYWLTYVKVIAFVVATAAGMVVNFCGQYLFVFSQKKGHEK